MTAYRTGRPAPRPIIRRRGRAVIVGLVLVALGAVIVGWLLSMAAPSAPVYTVAAVQTGLQRHPGAWVGRTILVAGVVQDIDQYGPLRGPRQLRVLLLPALLPPGPTTVLGGYGPQLWADPRRIPSHPFNALMRLLGTIPVLGPLMHVRDQRLHPGQQAVFRLTLLPTHRCAAGTCMSNADALLDDVQP